MIEHIQINPVAPRVAYAADGVQSAFTYPFAIFAPADIEVWLDDVRQNAGFSVSGAGISTGGAVLFAIPPAAGSRVTLRRRLAIGRTSDFQADGIIRAKTLNDEFDLQVAALQQVADDAGRAVVRAVTSASTADLTLPEPAAGKAIGWNADGTGLTNDPAGFAATVATVAGHAATASTEAGIASTQAGLASAAAAAAQAAQGLAEAAEASAAASAAAASVARIEWRGAWSDLTDYAVNDAVSHDGASWICVQAHTNQAPADNAWWDPLAAKGVDGAGSGDLLAANNLSDVADAAVARANLGAAAAGHTHASTAITDFVEATQDVVGAMVIAAGGSYDDGAGAITLPSGSAAIDARLAFLELNLAVNTLRDQIDTGWSVLKMVDGVADEFEDTAGIGSNDGTHDATGDYVHNPGSVTYGSNVASGKTEIGSSEVTTNGNMRDGNPGTLGYCKPRDGTGWVGLDLGSAMAIRKMRIYQGAGYCPTLGARYSDNGTSWTDIAGVSASGGASGWASDLILPASGSHRYWAFKQQASVTGGDGVWWYIGEMEMFVGTVTAPGNITVVSTATTAEAGTTDTEARIVLLHQPIDAVTLNTDVTVEVSRDNGTTWSAGTLINQGAFDATTNILSTTIDLSGQPSGTAMKWRFKTFNAKEQRLHGVWMQWR
ncbi:MAG: hypothetical protein HQL42_15980 [Alphaproteobacteria bacterium]|nr:hypothetical protein [Alphaproteobacteria bacterium]